MRLLRTSKVKLASLRLPGDWKRRLADPRTKAAADDLPITPRLQRPGVREDVKTIIYGRDRLAAAWLAGERMVEVDVWECTDIEAERAEQVENLRRNDDQDAIKARLVQIEIRRARGADDDADIATECCEAAPSRGEVAAARKAVAEKLGTTPAAIGQAERRARGWGAEAAPAEAEPCIETWGTVLPAAFLAEAAGIQAVVDKLDSRLREVVKAITEGQEGLPEATSQRLGLQGLRMVVKDASAHLRALRPEALCVYCKGADEGPCTGCGGTKLMSEGAVASSPKELRTGGKR